MFYSGTDLVLIIATCLAILGVLFVVAGMFLLIKWVFGSSVDTIAKQTTRMAQKGLAEEVAGLVGNASTLVEALNQLVRTSAGVGMFLVGVGLGMLYAAYQIAITLPSLPGY